MCQNFINILSLSPSLSLSLLPSLSFSLPLPQLLSNSLFLPLYLYLFIYLSIYIFMYYQLVALIRFFFDFFYFCYGFHFHEWISTVIWTNFMCFGIFIFYCITKTSKHSSAIRSPVENHDILFRSSSQRYLRERYKMICMVLQNCHCYIVGTGEFVYFFFKYNNLL